MNHSVQTHGTNANAHQMKPPRVLKARLCNICTHEFNPRTVFDRYCPSCKTQSELLRYSDWLPQMDDGIAERLPA